MSNEDLKNFVQEITTRLNNRVFSPINSGLAEHPEIRKYLNPAFPYPLNVRIGILDSCLAIEYIGPNNEDDEEFNFGGYHYPTWDVYDFIGLDIKTLAPVILEVNTNIENVSTYLGRSIEFLSKYFYDLTQQPSELIQMGSIMGFSKPKQPICVSTHGGKACISFYIGFHFGCFFLYGFH